MGALRLRVQLGWQPAEGPAKFWWQPSVEHQTVSELLEELSTHVGLSPGSGARLAAAMDGFAVLGSSRTELLRDGDTLAVSLARKRGPAPAEAAETAAGGEGPWVKRHKAAPAAPALPAAGAGGAADSSSNEDTSISEEEQEEGQEGSSSEESSSDGSSSSSSSSEESSSSSEEDEQGGALVASPSGQLATPAAPATGAGQAGSTAKKPSRSARRKAAKRRLRRMGVLPPRGKAGAAAGQPAAGADAANGAVARGGKAHAAGCKSAAAAPAADGRQVQGEQPKEKKMKQQEQQQGQKQGQEQKQRKGAAVAGAPEAVMPPGWQTTLPAQQAPPPVQQQLERYSHQQQQKQQGERRREERQEPKQVRKQARAPGAAAAATPAAAPAAGAAGEPMSEAAFGQLAPLVGLPGVGDVLAYRLLEVGPSMQPGVSEVRCGRVSAVDAGAQAVTLVPHPDPQVHPLSWQRAVHAAQRRAARRAEAEAAGRMEEEEEVEEDEEEDVGDQYDEDGTLVAELSEFVDVRVLQRQPPSNTAVRAAKGTSAATTTGTRGAPAGSKCMQQAAADADDLGPSSYSRLGPPRPAGAAGPGRGDVIAPEGGWAALYDQLRQRRAQLAQQEGTEHSGAPAAGEAEGTPVSAAQRRAGGVGGGTAQQVHSAPPAGGARDRSGQGTGGANGGRAGSLTPGATRPRAGVRRTALGPMLRLLREAEELGP